jgi:hypothetical protein
MKKVEIGYGLTCEVPKWEQGNYFFKGEWNATLAVSELFSSEELQTIMFQINYLVQVYNGIDYAVFFEHKTKGRVIAQAQPQLLKNTIMLTKEY